MDQDMLELSGAIADLKAERRVCRWHKFRDLPPEATSEVSARVQHILALNSIRTRLEQAESRLARHKARLAERAKHKKEE